MTKARNRTKSVTAKVKPSRRSDAEHSMRQQPIYARTDYRGADKLAGKIAIITGGDSGIGRAVAIAFANEAADVVVLYHENDTDADETRVLVEATGRRCLTIKGDIGDETFCQNAVKKAYDVFRRIDILVNNAAEQHPVEKPEQITSKQLLRTFQTNVFGMFFLTNAALPHLRRQPGATIINTGSVVAYRGHDMLIDYTSTKGAVIGYTRAMALSLAPDIRVNAVAPGPIWTPLIPSTFPDEKVGNFGADTPIGRAGQPFECAGAYVFLASADATYITGQVIHPNGGEVVNA
ncbi:MAG TPA: SDR family oxidoreductase [Tepidisphaeraceae bacterium]|nr:SDR family oxidoreductase [Tepidisphaeraceae bacterium]